MKLKSLLFVSLFTVIATYTENINEANEVATKVEVNTELNTTNINEN